MFTIDPILRRDTIVLGAFPLSLLLLMNDQNYPWLVLVPQRPDICEIYQLQDDDQEQLLRESCHVARVMVAHFRADKMNIAALGNIVPQLHLHHIVRYRNDPAWPGPVWGKAPPVPYLPEQVDQLRTWLCPKFTDFTPKPT